MEAYRFHRLEMEILDRGIAAFDDVQFQVHDPAEYVARYDDANDARARCPQRAGPGRHYSDSAESVTMSADATGRTAYTYDAWGRTVTKTYMADPANTYTATYMYRFGDKLKRYDTNLPGEETGIYNYDGLGKRRLKLVDDDYTWFRWAGWSILSEYGEGTDPTTLWDIAATPDKVYTPGLAERTSSSDYAYYLQDHLGSTRSVYDGQKTLLASLDYTPYGQPQAWRGNAPAISYTGHYWDAETGMYFAPFRYLMPGAGRWLTRDPLGFVDGANIYAYPFAPLMYTDPFGLKWCPPGWLGPVTIAIGATMGSLGATAAKSTAAGVALGLTPIGWGVLGLGIAIGGAGLTLWNLREQAEKVIEETGVEEPIRKKRQLENELWEELKMNPLEENTPKKKEPSDDSC